MPNAAPAPEGKGQSRTQPASQGASRPAPPSKSGMSAGWIAGIGGAVTIGLVAGVVMMARPGADSSATNIPVQTANFASNAGSPSSSVPPSFRPPSSSLPSSSPSSASAPAEAARQCRLLQRAISVSTNAGGQGTVRLRAGNYVSGPIALSTAPQTVVFPLLRPEVTAVEQTIVIEGRATDLIISSDVTNMRKDLGRLNGRIDFHARWVPLRQC